MLAKLRRWALFNGALWVVIFTLSGQWTSWLMWSFAIGMGVLTLFALTASGGDLAQERARPPSPGIDAGPLRWIRITASAAVIVSALDGGRLHWAAPIAD